MRSSLQHFNELTPPAENTKTSRCLLQKLKDLMAETWPSMVMLRHIERMADTGEMIIAESSPAVAKKVCPFLNSNQKTMHNKRNLKGVSPQQNILTKKLGAGHFSPVITPL